MLTCEEHIVGLESLVKSSPQFELFQHNLMKNCETEGKGYLLGSDKLWKGSRDMTILLSNQDKFLISKRLIFLST